jgi:hypothetical protein
MSEMAERGGHAPQPAKRIDLLSTESRLAGPVHVPCGARGESCTRTSRDLNSVPLLLGYAGVEKGNAPGRIRTDTARGLSPLPLRWATGATKWTRRQELHPHWLRSERSVSAGWTTPG